jgi:EmrB/QacA subfamily drug resistance transporter
MSPESYTRPDARSSRIAATIVAMAFFMEGLDSSILSTSLPQMALGFHVDAPAMSAAITSYLVSLAIFIPISGWVADRFGARLVFCSAIALFSVGSLLCGFSHTLTQLIVSRIVQGCGGAMMTPVGRLILTRIFPKNELLRAMSYFMLPGTLGPTVGPLVGGFMTTYFTWRWNFFINVPLGGVGIALALRFVPQIRMPRPTRFDVAGFILVAVGLALAQFALENLGRHTLPARVELATIVAAGVVIIVYYLHSRRRADPVLDLRMFRSRTFSVAVLAGGIVRGCMATVPFLLPLLLQLGFGLTPLQSGALTFLNTAGKVSMRAWTSHWLRRFGFRNVFLASVAASSTLIAGLASFGLSTPKALIGLYLFGFGVLRSAQMIGMGALAYSDVSETNMSKATSIFALAQRFSQSAGVGLSATLLSYLSAGHALTIGDFRVAFVCVGAAVLFSALQIRKLHPSDGSEVSGYRAPAHETESLAPQP